MPVFQPRPLIQPVPTVDLYVPEPPLLIMSTYGTLASFFPFTSDLSHGATVRYVVHVKRSFNLPPSGSWHCCYRFDRLRLLPPPQLVRRRFHLQKSRESR